MQLLTALSQLSSFLYNLLIKKEFLKPFLQKWIDEMSFIQLTLFLNLNCSYNVINSFNIRFLNILKALIII